MTIFSTLMTALSVGASPLQATTAADRAAALEARKRELGEALSKRQLELTALAGKASDEHAQGCAAAEAEAEARRLELSASIASEWYGDPPGTAGGRDGAERLLARWLDEPTRAASEALRALLLRVEARSVAELGASVHPGIVIDACAPAFLERFPGSCRMFGDDLGALGDEGPGSKASRVLASAPLGPVAFHRALEGLEESLERAAAAVRGPAVKARLDRYLARRAMITSADRAARVQAFEEQQRAAEQAEAVANFKPPTNVFRFGS